MNVVEWGHIISQSMAELSKKELRTIGFALDRFYGPKSLVVPQSFEDFKVPNVLARQLRLKGNRSLLMTDVGLEHLRKMVSTIYDANVFEGLADYSDVYNACQGVIENLLSEGQRPDDAQELIDLINRHLTKKIDNRTFVVPIFGLELDNIGSLKLGSMKIVPAVISYLDAAGVKHDHLSEATTIEITKTKLWLIGSSRGTASAAQEKFREQAELVVGMLAVSAASMFEYGANGFRIGVVMSPEDNYGRSTWLSWAEQNLDLTTHFAFPSFQDFKIDSELATSHFNGDGVFAKAFALLQNENRTPLEDAIAKAVYWYSDAHRETMPVMKLVKYWSCVETFFSAENKDITRSVSSGLTSVLVFGGFEFVPRTAYKAIKKRISDLYALRSKAVHTAAHRHVSRRDAAELSQWVSWMLINMVLFVEQGHTKVDQIKRICNRLDTDVSLASEI
jgi:hypothetical protein